MCLVPRCIRSTRRCKRCRGIPFNTTWRSQGYFQAGAIPNGVSAAGNIVVVVSIHPLVCLLASPSRQTCVVMNVYHESVNVGLCLFQSMNSHIVPHPHRYAFRCRRIIQILNENIVDVDGCSQLTHTISKRKLSLGPSVLRPVFATTEACFDDDDRCSRPRSRNGQ